MQSPIHSKVHASRMSGFSLVEISLALAIVAIALIALVGMLPSGLSNFRAAMDAQTAGEIFQRVVADAQETDFDTLLASKVETGGTGTQFYRLALRYFDDQGTEVKVVNPNAPTAIEGKGILYTVRVRGSLPGNSDPRNHSDTFPTSLPGFAAPRFNLRDVTFLTVQVAATGGVRPILPLVDSASFLISTSLAAKSPLSVRTYSAIVARNGYRRQP